MENLIENSQVISPVPEKKNNLAIILALFAIVLLVGAIGVYAGMKFGGTKTKNTIKTEIPTSIPSLSPTVPTSVPTVDSTSNWKTYTGAKYGFEFMYPNDYLLNDQFLKINQENSPLNSYGLSIIKLANKEKGQPPTIRLGLINTSKSVQEFIDYDYGKEVSSWEAVSKESGLNYAKPQILSIKTEEINKMTCTTVERKRVQSAPNSNETQYYFKNNSTIYVFSVNYGTYNSDTKEDGTQEKLALEQIIPTFNFVE